MDLVASLPIGEVQEGREPVLYDDVPRYQGYQGVRCPLRGSKDTGIHRGQLWGEQEQHQPGVRIGPGQARMVTPLSANLV